MSDGINFGTKVQTTGIKKEEFIKSLTDKKIDEAVAQSIFDKFNTNTVGDSANVLDKNEQVGIFAFLKKLAGSDTNITKEEYTAGSATAKSFGIDSQELLSNVVDAYNDVINADSKDDVEAKYNSDGSVTVGEETYTYNSDGSFKQVTSKVGEKEVTQTMKQKYAPVSLSANWKNQRDIASQIISGADGFKEIKSAKTADQVLDIIINKQGLEVTNEQKPKLRELLIKFNPSIFDRETGAVWVNADWSKLDFPSGKDVQSMISGVSTVKNSGSGSVETKVNSTETPEVPTPKSESPAPKKTYQVQKDVVTAEWNSNYTTQIKTRGYKYVGTNQISMDKANGHKGGVDADAILHLGGARYTFKMKGEGIFGTSETMDYFNITGSRSFGQQKSRQMINPETGLFDPNAGAFTSGKEIYLDDYGTNVHGAEFNGCPIKRVRDMQGTWIVVVQKGKTCYDMNELLQGRRTIVQPGTFFEQG